MFEPVAGERCFSQLYGGAGSIPDFEQPGPGWGDRWIFADADAFGWNRVRHCVAAGATVAEQNVRQLVDPRRADRRATCTKRRRCGRDASVRRRPGVPWAWASAFCRK